jgi:hypothetical protein
MARWIVLILAAAGGVSLQAANGFEIERRVTPRALFQEKLPEEHPAEAPAERPVAATPVDRIREMMERSQWRGLNLEVYGGIIATKHSMWSAGLGLSFGIFRSMSLSFRAEYNQELGAARDYRPQLRTAIFEPGVRFHLDFHESVALYSTHSLMIAAQYAFYQLDQRVAGSDLNLVFNLAAGSTHSVGLEFGDDFIRGFVETGFRLHIVIYQDADERVTGFQDNLRDEFTFQWLVFRLGARFYF